MLENCSVRKTKKHELFFGIYTDSGGEENSRGVRDLLKGRFSGTQQHQQQKKHQKQFFFIYTTGLSHTQWIIYRI